MLFSATLNSLNGKKALFLFVDQTLDICPFSEQNLKIITRWKIEFRFFSHCLVAFKFNDNHTSVQ